MFVTGPDVIKTVTHEEVDKESLGGASAHGSKSGSALLAPDEAAVWGWSASCWATCPQTTSAILRSVPPGLLIGRRLSWSTRPCEPQQAYDIRSIIRAADDQVLLEVHENYALNMVVGFVRVEGRW